MPPLSDRPGRSTLATARRVLGQLRGDRRTLAPGIDLDAVEELKRQAESGGGVVGWLLGRVGNPLTDGGVTLAEVGLADGVEQHHRRHLGQRGRDLRPPRERQSGSLDLRQYEPLLPERPVQPGAPAGARSRHDQYGSVHDR